MYNIFIVLQNKR